MKGIFVVCFLALLILPAVSFGDYPIAGTQPSMRPVGAPTITTVERDDAWYGRAYWGISQPYPESLKFLADQGNWYTPFNRPGMTSYYDIRNWHTGAH